MVHYMMLNRHGLPPSCCYKSCDQKEFSRSLQVSDLATTIDLGLLYYYQGVYTHCYYRYYCIVTARSAASICLPTAVKSHMTLDRVPQLRVIPAFVVAHYTMLWDMEFLFVTV